MVELRMQILYNKAWGERRADGKHLAVCAFPCFRLINHFTCWLSSKRLSLLEYSRSHASHILNATHFELKYTGCPWITRSPFWNLSLGQDKHNMYDFNVNILFCPSVCRYVYFNENMNNSKTVYITVIKFRIGFNGGIKSLGEIFKVSSNKTFQDGGQYRPFVLNFTTTNGWREILKLKFCFKCHGQHNNASSIKTI